jgi:hypothetical protein
MLLKKNGATLYRLEKVVRGFCADFLVSQAAPHRSMTSRTLGRYDGPFRTARAAARERDIATFARVGDVDAQVYGAARVPGIPVIKRAGRGH